MVILDALQTTRMAFTTTELIDLVGRRSRPNCRAQVWNTLMRLEKAGLVLRITKRGKRTKWLLRHH